MIQCTCTSQHKIFSVDFLTGVTSSPSGFISVDMENSKVPSFKQKIEDDVHCCLVMCQGAYLNIWRIWPVQMSNYSTNLIRCSTPSLAPA